MRKSLTLVLVAGLVALFGGLGTSNAQVDAYQLEPGDRVKITVFGEADLSGEFELDSSGVLSYPLIGAVEADGLTARGLEERLDQRLRGDYLIDPRISVEVLSYQPFYILGEVNNPGSFPYRAGLTVINAVAMAGGYTARADEGDIVITRGGENGREIEASGETMILPGDVVRVEERFF